MTDVRISLSETLAKNVSSETSQALLIEKAGAVAAMCRLPADTDDVILDAVCNPRVQNGFLATAEFLTSLDTAAATNEVIAEPAKEFLAALPMLAKAPTTTQVEDPLLRDSFLERFCKTYAVRYTQVSDKLEEVEDTMHLCEHIVTFFDNTLGAETFNEHVVKGFLEGFTKAGFPKNLKGDQIEHIAELVDEKTLNSDSEILQDCALPAITRLVQLENCTTRVVDKYTNLALSDGYIEGLVEPAITLALQCAEVAKQHRDRVCRTLVGIAKKTMKEWNGEFRNGLVSLFKALRGHAKMLVGVLIQTPEVTLLDEVVMFATRSPYATDPEIQCAASELACALLKERVNTTDPESLQRTISVLLSGVTGTHRKAHAHEENLAKSSGASGAQGKQNGQPSATISVTAPDGTKDTKDTKEDISPELGLLKAVAMTFAKERKQTTEFIVSGLINVVTFPMCSCDLEIVKTVIDIAECGIPSVVNDTAMLAINLYKQIVSDGQMRIVPSSTIIATLSAKLKDMAQKITDNSLKAEVGRKMLTLFHSLGQETKQPASRRVELAELATVKVMASMLPFIAELIQCNDKEIIFHPDEAQQEAFRNAWFYCVFFDFALHGHVSEDWQNPVTRIAEKVPVLGINHTHVMVKVEMAISGIINASLGQRELNSVKKRLRTSLPSASASLKVLNPAFACYFLSVYYLEILRARNGEYRALFSYLEDFAEVDDRIPNYAYYQNIFQAIACAVFTELLAGFKARRYAEESQSDLFADVVDYIFIHFCSSNIVVRQLSGQFLRMITNNFPQVLLHPRCTKTLLELVDIVSHGREIGPLDKTHIQFPNSRIFLALPEDAEAMNSLFHETVQLTYNWITESVHLAPTETFSAFHAYMRSFGEESNTALRQHYGVSLATEILSKAGLSVLTQHSNNTGAAFSTAGTTGTGGTGSNKNGTTLAADANTTLVRKRDEDELGSAFMIGLMRKTHYFGEFDCALELARKKAEDSESDDEAEKKEEEEEKKRKGNDKLAALLLEEFDNLGNGNKCEQKQAHKTLDKLVCRSCAFVINNQSHPHTTSLLNKIVWSPVRVFTPESLRVGTSAWSWLLPSLSRTLVEYLLSQMRLAWAWTIECRLGLFTDSKRPPNPLTVAPPSPASESTPLAEADRSEEDKKKEQEKRKDDCTPHRIWLDFLSERLIASENVESLQIDIIFEMVSRAVSEPDRLSVLCESFGTRFKLLLLALECIQVVRERRFVLAQLNKTADAKQRADAVDVLFLRRVYAAALAWFKEFPVWYEPPNNKTLADDVQCVCRFCEMLEGIINPVKPPAGYGGSAASRMTSVDGGSGLSVPRVSMSESTATGSVRSGRSGHNSTRSVSSVVSTRFASLVPPMTVPRYMQDTRLPEGDNARATVQLLLCFLGDELERIRVWNNPLNRIALQLRMSVDPTRLRTPQMPLSALMDAAWTLDPKLAVMLWVRNQSNEEVRRCVTEKVKANPEQVVHCAEALPLLVTEETARDNIPQLKHLLYWAPTDPLTAMSLLGRRYRGNAFVTHYALRVLKQFSPDTVIFYLPQLVQCLRYDDKGLVAEYLVDACRRSELLAHQLIWNTKTYPKKAPREGYKVDLDFSKRANRVRKRVIANFTKEQQERYEKEFQFFDRFTAISSRLLPVEPDERRNKLKEELRQIEPMTDDTVYLPFAPHIVVRSVDAENPLVLRSAEKVPIMVHFNVVEREHAQTQKPFLHSCIFKSGDDVRQDMLAVQVIELLKRVFDGAGLSLFLFPYKIIATEPDCGMIEVVPNTLSRDQIGQKTEGTLYDYYLSKYGAKNTLKFQEARNNFIRSMAAYAVASYILQVKDRHNGNILIDDQGHLVHIDFGFLFDRTPGGDFGFERAPFKITDEMIDIMGGKPTSDQFIWFMEQGVRAFLAARDHLDGIVTLVDLMIDTQLPCFKPTSIQNLRARFFPASTVPAAAKQMVSVMTYAFSAGGTFFTYFYDKFQEIDNGIAM